MYFDEKLEEDVIKDLLIAPELWKAAIDEYNITEKTFTSVYCADIARQGIEMLKTGTLEPDASLFEPLNNDYKFLMRMVQEGVTAANYQVHFKKLKDLEMVRVARTLMQNAIYKIEADHGVPDIDKITESIEKLRGEFADYSSLGKIETLADVKEDAVKFIRDGMRPLPLFGTGTFADMAFQLHEGETMVLSGTTGTGKTALASQWALTMALEGKRVLYVCTESTAKEIYLRFVASLCGVHHNEANDNTERGELFRLCCGGISMDLNDKLFLLCLDRRMPNPDDIEKKVLQIEKQYGRIHAMFLDYIQDIAPTREMARLSPLERIETIVNRVHDLCIFHGIAGIYLSQLNRTGEKDAMPTNDQIKNASKIAEKAHIVAFIYRKNVGIKKEENEGRRVGMDEDDYPILYSTKCRNTKPFRLKMTWQESRYIVKDDDESKYPICTKIYDYLPPEPVNAPPSPPPKAVHDSRYMEDNFSNETFEPFTNYTN